MTVKVKISELIIQNLIEICNLSDREQCGIFLGEINSENIIVEKIIHDKSSKHKTRFSSIRYTKVIYPDYKKYISENEIYDYIGEWHTHPSGNSVPSKNDNKAMRALLNEPKYRSPQELILGIVSSAENLRIFLYKYKKKQKLELEIISI